MGGLDSGIHFFRRIAFVCAPAQGGGKLADFSEKAGGGFFIDGRLAALAQRRLVKQGEADDGSDRHTGPIGLLFHKSGLGVGEARF